MGGLLEEADTSQSGDTAANQSNDNTAGQVIKDTGFNLDITVITAALMGVLMIAGILISIKNNYFAQSDE
jgi:preprotein translocase subunit SecG